MDLIKYVKFLEIWEKPVVTNFAHDPGKQTAFGISRVYHPNDPIWAEVDAGRTSKENLIKFGTIFYEKQAETLKKYTDYLPAKVHPFFVDAAINMGEDDAIVCWQNTLINFHYYTTVLVSADGAFGPKTKKASLGMLAYPSPVIPAMVFQQMRLSAYIEKVLKKPEKLITLGGWKNRVNSLTEIFLR